MGDRDERGEHLPDAPLGHLVRVHRAVQVQRLLEVQRGSSITTMPMRSKVWRSADRAYFAPLQPYPTQATRIPSHSA